VSNELNKQWYRYTANNGTFFAVMVNKQWGDNTAFGLTAFNTADRSWGPQSRLHRTRKLVYQDPATFRTVTITAGTLAVLSAIPATISVDLPGSATAETYNFRRQIDEKTQAPGVSRPLADRPS